MKKNFSILTNSQDITSLAIGGFDGVHIAHQELFKQLDENGAILVVSSGYENLTPKKYREEYVGFPIFYYKLKDIKHLEGDEFINLLKKNYPNLKKIVVGFDFCFGKDRKYNTKNLEQLFDGEVQIVKEIKFEDTPIHSRVIRTYLKDGKIELANKFLGKDYKIYGQVIKGQGLGEKNFVPTINIKIDDFLLPQEGVYITKTILNKKAYNSISFIGHRLTTDGNFAVETHILDENILNTDENISIKFLKKLRDNKKFETFKELKNQISKDMKLAKQYHINDDI